MQTPAWVPSATRFALIVWALVGAVYGALATGASLGGSEILFIVDTLAFRVWAAGLGLLALTALVAGGRSSRSPTQLPPWLVGGFAVGVVAWLIGSLILAFSGDPFGVPSPQLGRVLDTAGLRIAAGAFGYGVLLWFGAAPPETGEPLRADE